MSRLLTKSEIKYKKDLPKRIYSRQTKFFRRNLHLNHKDTYIKIVRIMSDDMFFDEVVGFKEPPRNVCFYMNHINKTKNIEAYCSISNSNFIITNNRTNKVIAINEHINNLPDFINLWIVRKNIPSFLKIKLGDILFTR